VELPFKISEQDCSKVLPKDKMFFISDYVIMKEKHLIDKYGMKVITAWQVRRKGHKEMLLERLRYLTVLMWGFDVDLLDSSIKKEQGTPVKVTD